MLWKQAMDRFRTRGPWIASLSFLVVVAAGWFVARPTRLRTVAPPAHLLVKGSPLNAALSTQPVDPAERARMATSFGNLPLSFEPNRGQTDPQVKFLSRNSHYNLFLTSDEAVFTLPVAAPETSRSTMRTRKLHATRQAVLRMKMLGANPVPKVEGDTQTQGRSNYFLGNDPSKWVRDLEQYARVNYRGIYPGIDLTFYGQQRQLEFDFIVKPGAHPESIALGVEGASKIGTDDAGNLVLTSDGGDVKLHKPVAYQMQDNTRQPVDANFVVKGKEVALAVGQYDRSRELVIDPSVSYSTYKGGSGEDQASSVAVDGTGAAYITGEAGNNTFPHTAGIFAGGAHDAFLLKLDSTGAQVYSTLFGGAGDESGNAIALDGVGGVYVAGATDSINFPGVMGKFQATLTGTTNAFVTKLAATTGILSFSTYLGGSTVDIAAGIAADSTGQVYVAGQTQSTNFPTQNAFQSAFGGNFDAFVTVLNPTFTSLVYSTYLGGSGIDNAAAIAIDSSKKIYVTGNTSGSFPITGGVVQGTFGGNFDAFVAKIDPTLSGQVSLVYSTYLGGSGAETAYGIAVDPAIGFAYVTGSTMSTNFPLQGAAFGTLSGPQDAFVTEVNATASAPLKFSTYLGGTGSEVGVAIALDGSKNVYVTGQTDSPTDFPTVSPTQSQSGGAKDAFVSEFDPNGGALVFSTYLGGSMDEDVVGTGVLGGIAVDGSNNIVVVGDTSSTNFPTLNPLQGTNGGVVDAFVTKYAPSTSAGSFTVSAGALSSTTITRGSSATSSITVTSISGFTGSVALSCSVMPATSKPPACSVTSPVTLTANGNQTATLTLSTVRPSVVQGLGLTALWLPMPGLLLLGASFGTKDRARRRLTGLSITFIALVGVIFLASCGSGNGGGGGGGGGNPGTTTGSYTVTVSGSGGGVTASSSALSFSVQ